MMGADVYAINLEKRTDRKQHIIKEFCSTCGFNLQIVKAIQHKNAALGLWRTIKSVIIKAVSEQKEYIIICEDDHEFTRNFSEKKLEKFISQASQYGADILLGGVSWFDDAWEVKKDLFWVSRFSGLQFTVIFEKFYVKILEAHFDECDAADYLISDLTNNKYVAYPFFSRQKEFGYSDVTFKNNVVGRVSEIFEKSAKKLRQIKKINKYYKSIPRFEQIEDFDEIEIRTFLICSSQVDIEKSFEQFKDRTEFAIEIVFQESASSPEMELWNAIVMCIKSAVVSDEDVVVITTCNHQFTTQYSKKLMMETIVQASRDGCEILLGSVAVYGFAVPITVHQYWINSFSCSSFIIVYKQLFTDILNYSFREADVADAVLSKLTSQKMLIQPFISRTNSVNYSGKSSHLDAETRLKKMHHALLK